MIPYEEALKIVLSHAHLLDCESAPLMEAVGRVLACDVASDVSMPPFDKSAMDGYACRREDLPGPLRVVEVIPAGVQPQKTVGTGECAKIMTGAMVPAGADCVIMVEHTEAAGEGLVRFTREGTAVNICYQDEDVKSGDIVLRQGTRLAPQHIAILAAAGCVAPAVVRRPRVAVIATGDELVEPDVIPGPSQIRNSNSWQIRAQMEQAGAAVTYYGIVGDTLSALDNAMKKAMAENDVILFSGGVSMGDFDLVPAVMRANGFDIPFDSVAIKPGKPSTFGVGKNGTYCFGLPGNPISTFVVSEILVKPFLFALMGHAHQGYKACLPLAEAYTRKRGDRQTWVPVEITPENTVRPTTYHGSAHISALGHACGFIVIPRGVTEIPRDTPVQVWPI